MEQKKYFEISQDGLAYISRKNGEYSGLGTYDLQTCMALIIELDTGFVLLHDTGKINLDAFCGFVSDKGNVSCITSFENVAECDKCAKKRNYERRVQIKNILKYSATFWQETTNTGKIYVSTSGVYSKDIPESEIEKPYQAKLRLNIGKINNFFLSPSQFIRADLQFDDKPICAIPEIIHSRKNMEEEINRLSSSGQDRWASLGEGLMLEAQKLEKERENCLNQHK